MRFAGIYQLIINIILSAFIHFNCSWWKTFSHFLLPFSPLHDDTSSSFLFFSVCIHLFVSLVIFFFPSHYLVRNKQCICLSLWVCVVVVLCDIISGKASMSETTVKAGCDCKEWMSAGLFRMDIIRIRCQLLFSSNTEPPWSCSVKASRMSCCWS